MILRPVLSALLGLSVAAACGSKPDPKTSGDVVTPEEETLPPMFDASAPGVPRRCMSVKGMCLPPIGWANNLCEEIYEDLALYMFQQGTPWERAYMNTELNAMNGWGLTVDEDLQEGEEVLVVAYRGNDGMMQVEGSDGTYDVLRWNGNCATVDANQIVMDQRDELLNSSIEWWKLSDNTRSRLMQDPIVAASFEEEAKACKGASVGRARNDCKDVHKEFMKTVASAVRGSQDLPVPSKTPDEHREK